MTARSSAPCGCSSSCRWSPRSRSFSSSARLRNLFWSSSSSSFIEGLRASPLSRRAASPSSAHARPGRASPTSTHRPAAVPRTRLKGSRRPSSRIIVGVLLEEVAGEKHLKEPEVVVLAEDALKFVEVFQDGQVFEQLPVRIRPSEYHGKKSGQSGRREARCAQKPTAAAAAGDLPLLWGALLP